MNVKLRQLTSLLLLPIVGRTGLVTALIPPKPETHQSPRHKILRTFSRYIPYSRVRRETGARRPWILEARMKRCPALRPGNPLNRAVFRRKC